ncbi:hypothetical protein KP79_PYT23342 [Mizuhopecten yessoensis]|uniref:Uncharacterized protein n=1 Tax=Mizuhopecten yessoensis TaxID=6573 RepID=A0A210PPZ2_MIZYE|nr:hypothetical protein KP79_PYT23342 [Mizuhopecten yessoensis]
MNKILFLVLCSCVLVFISAQYGDPYSYGGYPNYGGNYYSPYGGNYAGGQGYGQGYGLAAAYGYGQNNNNNNVLVYGLLFLAALWALNISGIRG